EEEEENIPLPGRNSSKIDAAQIKVAVTFLPRNTRSEPSHRRVLLCDSKDPVVPHSPSPLSRMGHLPCALISKGGSIMQEAELSPLATWQTFCILIGTADASA